MLFTLLSLIAAPASAQTFPPLTGRVVDNANLLDPAQEAALTAKLEALETSTGRQLVVATVPDLQGYEIEDYGYQLGRAWGIGEKGKNNGVVLLVAPKERKVRIEVGYGLEPYATDAFSSRVIQDTILPRFKANDYPGGIEAGVDALIAQLQLPPEEAAARQKQVIEQGGEQPRQRRKSGGIPLGLIFWGMVFAFILLSSTRGRGGKAARRYSRGGGSNLPVWLWVASEIAQNAGRSRGGSSWGGGGGGDWGGGGGGGGFSGGGGSFGGGGASGGW